MSGDVDDLKVGDTLWTTKLNSWGRRGQSLDVQSAVVTKITKQKIYLDVPDDALSAFGYRRQFFKDSLPNFGRTRDDALDKLKAFQSDVIAAASDILILIEKARG